MVTWAHKANDAQDPDAQQAWATQVVTFTSALRLLGGIDADLDLFHAFEPGIDWNRWGPARVQACARVLVVVNAAWRERFEGTNPPTEGAGAAAEADVLLGQFADDQVAFRARTLLVVLPGASEADIPTRLLGVQRVHVTRFDAAGLEDLVRHLTGQPRYRMPPLGRVPLLLPATQQDLLRVAAHPEQVQAPTVKLSADLTSTSPLSAAGETTAAEDNPEPATGRIAAPPAEQTAFRAWSSIALELAAALHDGGHPGSGWPSPLATHDQEGAAAARERGVFISHIQADAASAEALSKLLLLTRQRNAAPAQPPSRPPTLSEETGALLGPQLERIAAWLERPNRCWLLLAAQPVTASPRQAQAAPAGAKQRAERTLRRMVEETSLPVTLSGFDSATRATRRTVFAGHPSPSFRPGPLSSHWRLEVGDRGEGVAAASIGGDVHAERGLFGPFGQPEKNTVQAHLSLPVRRDRLELWLLVQLELVAAHYLSAAEADPRARIDEPLVIGLQARLLLPPVLTLTDHHQSTVLGVTIVEEHRDLDGYPTQEAPCPGGHLLPLEAETADTEVLIIDIGWLSEPGALITFAHNLAVQLLEHFGLEGTQVLTDGGELDELAAGAADQQHVWQHARALGIPHDETSPATRRQRHTDLVAQARAALRR